VTIGPDAIEATDQARVEPPLLVERMGHIAVLTLNRPDVRNAISPEMACRLADAFEAIDNNSDIRVAVLTGHGEQAFCSGGDLARTLPLLTGARQPSDDWDRRFLGDPMVIARSSLRDAPLGKPLIAAINGACLAGGMEIVLGTDIRIAAEHAVFALPEAVHALIPFAGALVRLPRQIPPAIAMEMLLTGERISAQEAHRIGLLNHVCPPDQVMTRALAIAGKVAANGPVAVREIKRAVLASSGRGLQEGYRIEDESMKRVMATHDAREGPLAFVEKRRPVYHGQ
jgi:enoyl-CoA hydratase